MKLKARVIYDLKSHEKNGDSNEINYLVRVIDYKNLMTFIIVCDGI